MNRKAFLKTCCYTAIGLPIITSLQSCGGIHFATAGIEANRLIVKKSEFIYLKKNKAINRDFVMIDSGGEDFPICLYKAGEDDYKAALMSCTHRGCELNVGGRVYTCPCHGSEFSIDGKVLEGPADRDLKTFKTETDDENIYIGLG